MIVTVSLRVLFVRDGLKPIDCLAVEYFRDGDVRHANLSRGTVPMLLANLEEDDITRPDFFNGTAFALNESKSLRDDDRLTRGMCVPAGTCAGFEGDDAAVRVPPAIRRKQGVDANIAGKPVCGADHRGCGAYSCDFHDVLSNRFIVVTKRTPGELLRPVRARFHRDA